jgi:hypothetical protein
MIRESDHCQNPWEKLACLPWIKVYRLLKINIYSFRLRRYPTVLASLEFKNFFVPGLNGAILASQIRNTGKLAVRVGQTKIYRVIFIKERERTWLALRRGRKVCCI